MTVTLLAQSLVNTSYYPVRKSWIILWHLNKICLKKTKKKKPTLMLDSLWSETGGWAHKLIRKVFTGVRKERGFSIDIYRSASLFGTTVIAPWRSLKECRYIYGQCKILHWWSISNVTGKFCILVTNEVGHTTSTLMHNSASSPELLHKECATVLRAHSPFYSSSVTHQIIL